jgi:UBX domain-containing protein 1/4
MVRYKQAEKVDEVAREKQRREMGKQVSATREQMEKETRMREYALQKREKQAAKAERERLREE